MKNEIYKKVAFILIATTLLFFSIYNNGEKFVKDTGSIICLDCIGLG